METVCLQALPFGCGQFLRQSPGANDRCCRRSKRNCSKATTHDLGSIQSWSHLDLTGNAGRPVEGKLSAQEDIRYFSYHTKLTLLETFRDQFALPAVEISLLKSFLFVLTCQCVSVPSLSRAQERGPNPIGDDTQPVTNQRGLDAKGLGQK